MFSDLSGEADREAKNEGGDIRIFKLTALVIFVVLFNQLRPPHQQTEAIALTDTQINKSVQEAPKKQKPKQKTNEVKPIKQESKPKTSKPAVQAVMHPTGCENYRTIVEKYNWNTSVALAVMKAESGCRPYAIGDNRVIGGIYAPSCGLFQIRTLAGRPSCTQLHEPETNVAWAYRLYTSNGWQPWSVCNHGIVSCY
jgi:hypothetical protein